MKIKQDFVTNSSSTSYLMKNPEQWEIDKCDDWAHIVKMKEPGKIEKCKHHPDWLWCFHFVDDNNFILEKKEIDDLKKSIQNGDIYYKVTMDATNQGFLEHYDISTEDFYNGP